MKHLMIKIFLINLLINAFLSPSVSAYQPPLFSQVEKKSHFKNYTFIKEIGKGTHSTVLLAKDIKGKKVAIKKYSITDPKLVRLLKQNGIRVERYLQQLAEKELKIGQLTDHPNIVKVKEAWLENSAAYVAMEYVEGKTFNQCEKYPLEISKFLMQQLLSAIEHLLLRNIIVDDLWTGNILISEVGHLTLIDLGGTTIIDDAQLPLEHYQEMVENILGDLGGEAAYVLDRCEHLLPAPLKKEKINITHLKSLVIWVKAIQKELSSPTHLNNTISQSSAEKILFQHRLLQVQYPNHLSFNTGQHSNFLVYSLIAEEVLRQFSPGKYPDHFLQNMHFLRYPHEGLPKNLEAMFKLLPVREDFDTASTLVGNALISVSPSLQEAESEESAWAIFEKNERKADVTIFLNHIFESEKISPIHFRTRIKSLLKERPKSSEGLIYNFFIPIEAPLHKAIYLSEPYGIPRGDPLLSTTLRDFYTKYQHGLVEETNAQFRFLPSALISENGFNLEEIRSYRFTTIESEKLHSFAKLTEEMVSAIFDSHFEEMVNLAALSSATVRLKSSSERQKGYQKICYHHLLRRDIQLALYYWYKIDEPNQFSYLPGIIICLLKRGQIDEAYQFFLEYEKHLMHRDQLIARFALTYFEQDNSVMFNTLLNKISDPQIRLFLMVIASARYPEYALEQIPEQLEALMSDDELIECAAL